MPWLHILMGFCLCLMVDHARSKRPHILIIMADDLGYNDVQYRDRQMVTPNIDKLSQQGVNFKYSYMYPKCTPSRAAMLTGVSAFKMGLQANVLTATRNNTLPLKYKLLPEHLQDVGYKTYMVGKWHLGFCAKSMTPNYRGFNYFYGMYNGAADYYTHVAKGGYDNQENVGSGAATRFSVDYSANMTYSTTLYTDKALQLLDKHDPNTPLFLYLSYQAVHGPLQVPDQWTNKVCGHVTQGETRKVHCGMTAAMDVGIGQVMQKLEERGFDDNLITMFSSDNGGPVKLGSSNWPLRGSKITLWEGGTRVVSILHSKQHLAFAYNSPQYTEWDGIMNAVDWFPTLLKAAAGHTNKRALRGIDGMNQWDRIKLRRPGTREWMVYNINDVKKNSAIRFRKYKLIKGGGGQPDSWYNPPAGTPPSPGPGRYKKDFLLYDLEADPEETVNLWDNADLHKIKEKMMKKLDKSFRQMQPTVLSPMFIKGGPPNNTWTSGWC